MSSWLSILHSDLEGSLVETWEQAWDAIRENDLVAHNTKIGTLKQSALGRVAIEIVYDTGESQLSNTSLNKSIGRFIETDTLVL